MRERLLRVARSFIRSWFLLFLFTGFESDKEVGAPRLCRVVLEVLEPGDSSGCRRDALGFPNERTCSQHLLVSSRVDAYRFKEMSNTTNTAGGAITIIAL